MKTMEKIEEFAVNVMVTTISLAISGVVVILFCGGIAEIFRESPRICISHGLEIGEVRPTGGVTNR